MIALILALSLPCSEPDWNRISNSCCRVTVDDNTGKTQYHGTGCLVRNNMVVTNYHVIEPARGNAVVVFPNGTQSVGQVVKVDKTWDLAAISIEKVDIPELKLSRRVPTLRMKAWSGGFGPIYKNAWRNTGGTITAFTQPSPNHPSLWIELDGQTEQGSSGGPIVDEDGDLLGILWGSKKRTHGSSVVVVRRFIEDIPTERVPAKSLESPLFQQGK